MLQQTVHDDIGIHITAQFNADPKSLTVGFITQIRDSIKLFILYKLCDLFDQTSLIHCIRKLCHDDTALAICHGLDIVYSPYTDLAASGSVGFFDACFSKDGCSCREIRSLYDLHQFFDGSRAVFLHPVVYDLDNGSNHLTQVVRRNIRCHTNGDTGAAIYQNIGKTSRKNRRFFLSLIKVRHEINGILANIRQHLHGNTAQSCLGVSHRCGAVAVHGTEVSMSIYKRVTGRPFLSHINQCAVNGAVAVRVIFTHCITDDTGGFTVRLIRTVIQLNHRIKHSSLHRFQAVAHVRECPGGDNAHRIIDVRRFHCLFQINVMNFVKYIWFHLYSFRPQKDLSDLNLIKYPGSLRTSHLPR